MNNVITATKMLQMLPRETYYRLKPICSLQLSIEIIRGREGGKGELTSVHFK